MWCNAANDMSVREVTAFLKAMGWDAKRVLDLGDGIGRRVGSGRKAVAVHANRPCD